MFKNVKKYYIIKILNPYFDMRRNPFYIDSSSLSISLRLFLYIHSECVEAFSFGGRDFEIHCFHSECNSMIRRTITANSFISRCEELQRQQEPLLLPMVFCHLRVGIFSFCLSSLSSYKPSLLKKYSFSLRFQSQIWVT